MTRLDPLDPAEPRFDDAAASLRPLPPMDRRERARAVLDALGMTPARAVGAVVVALAAIAAAVWLLRPPPAPVEATLPMATPPPALVSTTVVPTEVVVHVAGAVVRPGVLTLPAGSRVVDAIDAAGGVTPDADAARLNLAAEVVDGERVYVPRVGEAVPDPVAASPGEEGSGGAGPVDLNTATADELDSLPGVGPATAQAIIEWRDEHGGFTSVDQLLDVRGIGEAKLADLRDLVTV